MKKSNFILGFLVNILLGITLGVITELALIFNIKWLIQITQNEIFWAFVVFIVAVFSKSYLSTILNTTTNIVMMDISYYMVRLIKSGYTDIYSMLWYGIMGICLSLYVGTIVHLIKYKIIYKKIDNNIPKISLISMIITTIIGIIISLTIRRIPIDNLYIIEFLIIIGAIIGALYGRKMNNRNVGAISKSPERK